MSPNHRLAWTVRNRTRPTRMSTAGAAISQWMEAVRQTTLRPVEDVVQALAEVVDRSFQEHCSVSGIRRHTLHIGVNDPALIPEIRIRWEGRIRLALRRQFRRHSINKMVFEYQLGSAAAGDGSSRDQEIGAFPTTTEPRTDGCDG